MRIAEPVLITAEDREWLRKQTNGGVAPQRLAERCRIVSLGLEGQINEQIAAALNITRQKAARWRTRFASSGRAGLEQDAPGRGRKPAYGPEMQALIVERTLLFDRPPPRIGASARWRRLWM